MKKIRLLLWILLILMKKIIIKLFLGCGYDHCPTVTIISVILYKENFSFFQLHLFKCSLKRNHWLGAVKTTITTLFWTFSNGDAYSRIGSKSLETAQFCKMDCPNFKVSKWYRHYSPLYRLPLEDGLCFSHKKIKFRFKKIQTSRLEKYAIWAESTINRGICSRGK